MQSCRRAFVIERLPVFRGTLIAATLTFGLSVAPFFTAADDSIIPVDGLAALIGGGASAEFDASPMLISDIELEARLILTEQNGLAALADQPTPEEWRQAVERAILVRLLSDQARRLNETASEEDRRNLLGEIVIRLGGTDAMNQLLARLGTSRYVLDRWVENAVLAAGQLRLLLDQAPSYDIPSERRTARPEHRESEAERNEKIESDTIRRYRRTVGRTLSNEALRERLAEIMRRSYVRVLR